MTIAAQLEYGSEIAAGAKKDASAINALVESLSKLSAGTAKATQAQTVEAKIAAQVSMQREALAAKSLAAQNAAVAKLITAQQKRDADLLKIEAKGAQDRLTAETKAEQKRLELAQKSANDIAKVKAKGATSSPSRGPSMTPSTSAGTAYAPPETSAMAGMAAGALAAVAAYALSLAHQAVAYADELLHKGAEMAIKATTFREDMVGAFEAMGKSSVQSERLYKQAIDLSIKLGRDPGILAAEFKRLSAAGYKDNQIAGIAKMLADVGSVKGEAKAKALETLLEKTNAKGTIDKGTISGLVKQGVSQKALYEELAKVLHKPVADIPDLVKKGKISADEAIGAITKVVEKGVSGAAAKMAESVPALITRIKLAFASLFDSVDTKPIKDALKKILEMLTGPAGTQLKKSIGSLFGSIFELIFGPISKGDRIASVFAAISAGIQKVANFIKAVTPGVHGFIDGFLAGFAKISPAIGEASGAMMSLLRHIGVSGSGWQVVGKAIGTVVGALVLLVEVASVVASSVVGTFASITAGLYAILYGMGWAFNESLKTISSAWDSICGIVTNGTSIIVDSVSVIGATLSTGADDVKGILVNVWSIVGDAISSILDTLSTGAADSAAIIGEFISSIGSMFSTGSENVKGILVNVWSIVGDAISSILDTLSTGAADAVGILTNVAGSIWDVLSSVVTDAESAGAAIVNGLVSGIESNASAIGAAILGAAQDAVNTVKQFLGIASPSRLFHEMGGHTAAGFAGGIDAHAHMATRAANDMASDAAGAAGGAMSPGLGGAQTYGGSAGDAAGGGGRSSGGGGHTFIIQVAAGAAASAGGDEALTLKIRDKIEELLREYAEVA
jgi:phage-related protein